jgi:DNA-binding NtrC family response regulator
VPKNASILLVDDDLPFQDVVTAFAEKKDCTVTGAATLAHGLKMIAERRYDLVLLDLSLPDGNGLDLIGRLDPQQAGQVVVVTGHPTVETAVSALQLPVLDYLIKPVEGARLAGLLDQGVAAARLRAAATQQSERCGELIGASTAM